MSVQAAFENVERLESRMRENAILRGRFHPNVGHYFDVADEIYAIRLRNAEQDLDHALSGVVN